MKKSMVSVMMMAVVANTVLAGELPFTAKLTPGQEPNSGDNMVKFVIENNAMETITGVVITRNNGKLFDYVVQLGAGVGGVITSPSVYVGALGASTVGYIREFWQYNNDGTMNSEIGPEWLTGYLRGPEGYEPTHRTVVRTGFFSTYENVGNYFAARNHGYLRVPSGGTHYFRMSVDDHGYVMFRRADGTEVVLFSENYNANKGVMHNSSQNPVMFTAGEIVYFEAFQIEVDGSDYLRLEWAKPWTPPSTLATPALRSEALDAFNAWLKKPTTYHMINNGNGDDPNRLILDDDKSLYWDGRWRWIKDGDVTDQVKFEIITYLTFPETYNIAWSKLPVSNFSTKRPAGTTVPLTIFPALDDGSMIMNNGPSSAIRIAGLDVKMGEKISFEAALEELIVKNYGYAPQEVLWNLNDQTAKTTIEVFGANGNSSMITLGSTPRTDNAEYEFKSTARPVRLEVKSIGADGEINERAARFRVVVIDPTIEGDDKEVYRYDALGDTPSQAWANPDNLRAGMQVTFEAAEEIYFDEERHFLYHTYNASEFGDKVGLAVERYVAWGLSVNGTPQTGDPTRYSFEINADTKIEFRTRHEYALDVASDFSQTLAHLKTSTGAPWAASLTSAASGNPDPGAGVIGSPEPGTGAPGSVRHWVEAESQVVAQIDAEVQDIALCAQMLYTRYVPYDFLGTGAVRGDETLTAGSVYTNALREPKLANLRHQINFTMDGPGSITYRWKLQYGAYVQSPEAALRKVQKRTASIPETWQDIDPVGAVYWFDQGDAVRILAAASKGTVGESKALTGWMLGDGYYFQGECNLNTQTGEPVGLSITRDESNNPVARWLSKLAIPSGGAEYNGLFIDTLLRPVAVTWNYGRMIFYDPDLKLGEYMLQGRSKPIEMNPKYASVVARLFEEPSTVEPADGAIWDPNAKVLFPVKPGSVKAMYTGDTPDSGFEVHITARWPDTPHYAHIADTPRVQLTPDPAGSFLFVAKAFEEESVQAVVQNDSEFGAAGHGWTLLRFKEIKRVGRSDPKEYIALRTVRTQALQTSLNANQSQMAIIGQPVRDVLDRAGFGTGHLVYQEGVRYNPGIYDGEKLTAVRGMDIYDMARLTALYPQRVILHPEALPGPVIPVNEYPAAVVDTQWITIAWYEDPIRTDGILWPHAARRYTLRWPTGPAEGLTRIVIASEWGSESLGADGYDQVIADGADGFPIETTFNPTRFADLKIYAQGDPELAGYNPNEEHALLAPSFRYADVSPRPAAVYAL
ncbi:MAG: hypothetical protein FWF84_02200, partial [Kiritimatiellaeota bacterium]|nr:hypothetical protein [Kiritimatiellota bacterium]